VTGDFTAFLELEPSNFEIKKVFYHDSRYNSNGIFYIFKDLIYFEVFANDPML